MKAHIGLLRTMMESDTSPVTGMEIADGLSTTIILTMIMTATSTATTITTITRNTRAFWRVR
jgi:hypothetical protein